MREIEVSMLTDAVSYTHLISMSAHRERILMNFTVGQ